MNRYFIGNFETSPWYGINTEYRYHTRFYLLLPYNTEYRCPTLYIPHSNPIYITLRTGVQPYIYTDPETCYYTSCTVRNGTLSAQYGTLSARNETLSARYETLLARNGTLPARYETLLARYETLCTKRFMI
jgi:hypothetical protein